MKRNGSEPLVLVEERVDYSHIAPSGFGTADMLIVGKDEEGRGLLHIVDFKAGSGIYVDVDHNSQLSLYALGGLHAYGYIYPIETIRMTIVQPRLENINTFECTYGGVGHIGGGAMSGKDPSKVDRSGAYAARKIAVDIVRAGYADKAEVQIAYAIGVADPVSVYVETFGTEHQDRRFIEQYVRENYDLTPRGIIDSLHLLDVDYNEVSAYGHFGKKGLPWEQ